MVQIIETTKVNYFIESIRTWNIYKLKKYIASIHCGEDY